MNAKICKGTERQRGSRKTRHTVVESLEERSMLSVAPMESPSPPPASVESEMVELPPPSMVSPICSNDPVCGSIPSSPSGGNGDLTGNGFIDFDDLTLLLSHWDQAATVGEGNLVDPTTSPVDFDDLTFLLSKWTGPDPSSTAPVTSDLTGDGFVDFDDLTLLLSNWNQDVTAGEGNLVDTDKTPVDFNDLTVLLSNWDQDGMPGEGNLVHAASTPIGFDDVTVLLSAWTGPGPADSPQAAVAEATVSTLANISTLDIATTESRFATLAHFDRLGQRDHATLRRAYRTSGLPSHDAPLRRLQAVAVDRALVEHTAPEGETIVRRRAQRGARR